MQEIEQNIYETDGALALKPRVDFKKPGLRLVTDSTSGEKPPVSTDIISFQDFKTRKLQELLTPKIDLMPKTSFLRNLRREVTFITTPPKKPEFKAETEVVTPPVAEESKESDTQKSSSPDLLKGTGFTAMEEIVSLRKKYNEGIAAGLSKEEVIKKIVTENVTNIRWYQWEYTMSDPILPNPVAQNEKGELVNSKSGYSIVDMTGDKERDGSVKASVVNTQELLKDAKEGDTVMIVSPPGWTGRKDDSGKDIEYPEAEVFAFIKGEGRDIRALTFISELTIEQCQEFRNHFITPNPDFQDKKQTEREKIIDMVASPIFLTGGKVKFEDILDKIEAIKGGKIMREANGANRTYAEAREFLARGDELQQLPDLCEEVILTYEKYLTENIENINDPQVFDALYQRMQLTVLEISKILKPDKKDGVAEAPKEMSYFYQQAMSSTNVIDQKIMKKNYEEQIAFLMTRPGCNGGGASEAASMFGSSLSEVLSGASGGSFSGMGGSGGLSKEEGGICMMCSTKNECTERCYKCGGMLLKK